MVILLYIRKVPNFYSMQLPRRETAGGVDARVIFALLAFATHAHNRSSSLLDPPGGACPMDGLAGTRSARGRARRNTSATHAAARANCAARAGRTTHLTCDPGCRCFFLTLFSS